MEQYYIKFVSESIAEGAALEECIRDQAKLFEEFGVVAQLIHLFDVRRTHVYRFAAIAKSAGWPRAPYQQESTAITAALRALEEQGHPGKRIDLEGLVRDA